MKDGKQSRQEYRKGRTLPKRNHLLSPLSAVKEEPIHQVKAHGLWITLTDTPKGVLYLPRWFPIHLS